MLFKGTPTLSPEEIAAGLRRPRRRGQRGDRQGLHGPVLPAPGRVARPGDAGAHRHAPAPHFPTSTRSARWCWRRSRCTRTTPRTRSTTWRAAVFRRPAAGAARIGTAEVIGSVPRHGARLPRAHYTAPTIVVAAAATWPRARAASSRRTAAAASREPRATRYEPAPRPPPTRCSQEKATEQYHLCLGGPGLSRNDPRRYAQSRRSTPSWAAPWSSRLFQEVREKRGLAYSVGSYTVATPTPAGGRVFWHGRTTSGRPATSSPRACARSATSRCPTPSSAAPRTTSRGAWCSAWRARARA